MINFYADPVNDDDAMKSLGVAVTMKITNIGTQGYPGVGKTSVLDLAMGKDPAPTRTSTDCVDPPLYHMMIKHEDSDEWEKVTTDEMFQMVCGAVKKKIEEMPPDSDEPMDAVGPSTSGGDACVTVTATTNEPTTQATTKHVTPVIEQVLPPLAGNSDPTPNLLSDHLPGPSHDSSSDSSNSVPPSIWFSVLMNQLTQKAGYEKSDIIFNSHWVFVNDCGGQPPFLDAAALFPLNSCLQIFALKLNESLDEKAEFSYYVNNKPAQIDECVLLTHKEVIETMAKSVASIEPPHTSSANEAVVAKFTIVGTFYDQINECSETLEEKESALKTLLKPYKHVRIGNDVILPLNASTKNAEARKSLTKKLQKLIFDKSNKITMTDDIRLCWFGFYLSLLEKAEKEEKVVLTLSECYKIGEFLGMDNNETKRAVRLFHKFGLIMHFDTPFANLQNFVIVFTKPVLKTVSQIISVSFLNRRFLKEELNIHVDSDDKEQLQKYGFLELSILKKCIDSKIEEKFMLGILKHVKIIAELPCEEYFMPCALSYAPENHNELEKLSAPHRLSHPWVIRLRQKRGARLVYIPIPVGYLPTLVVFLLTQDESCFSTNCKKRQYRNFINLQYSPGGTVYFVERHLQLEVYYSLCDDLPDQCSVIRRLVLNSIHQAEERLRIRQGVNTKVDCFLCFCGEGSPSAHQTCSYNPESKILECEIADGCCKRIDRMYSYWLGMLNPLYY